MSDGRIIAAFHRLYSELAQLDAACEWDRQNGGGTSQLSLDEKCRERIQQALRIAEGVMPIRSEGDTK